MFVKDEIIRETENKIIKYYQNIKEIQWQNVRSIKLQERLKKVKLDIEHSNIILCIPSISIDYSIDKVDGGKVESSIDKAVDKAFYKLEEEVNRINAELIEVGIIIRKLEGDNDKMEYTLNLLNDESKKLIKLKYGQKESQTKIAYELNMSRATIELMREEILKDI